MKKVSIFWNKQEESNRVIYTSTRAMTRRLLVIFFTGLLLAVGLPFFSNYIPSLSNPASGVIPILLILSGLGAVMMFFVWMGISIPGFFTLLAKLKRRKVESSHTSDGDTVIIIEK